jgi:hypothetical protein
MVAPSAPAQEPACKEQETTEPAADDAKDLLELQPNTARPTFDVSLKDEASGGDEISFSPAGGKRVGRKADIGAEVTDIPRAKSERLGGRLSVAAHANESGRRVVVEICLDEVPRFAAGRYEGTISVFGPRFADFNYALVITAKWPWWSAVAVIVVTVAGFLLVASLTGLLAFEMPKGWKSSAATALGGVVAAFLGGVTYWSIYAKNDTWGDEPGTHMTALVIASFTAATGGAATLRRVLRPPPEGDSRAKARRKASKRTEPKPPG